MNRTTTTLWAVLAVAAGAAPALAGPPTIPDTPAGRHAAAFIAAFNTGDEADLRKFEAEHRADSASRRRSLEDRVTRLRSLQADWGRLDIRRVLSSGEHDILIVVEPERVDGWIHLAFEFEDESPCGLLGIAIEGPVDPESSATSNKSLDHELRQRVVNRIADELVRSYAFEDVGQRMAEGIRKRLADGGYDGIEYAYPFAQRLTHDLRAICHDKHLRVSPRVPRTRRGQRDSRPESRRQDPDANYGFVRVEVLPGNVGYIKLNGFSGTPDAKPTAAAAMAFVANTDALIFDVRENGGGSPMMINFLCGYLFDKPVHLNSFDNRAAGTFTHTYSDETVPGKLYGQQKPVYVLTSGYTFSGAEEFTYDLKHLKRATVVGETTGGGAHPVRDFTVNKYFTLRVPFARAVNPITGTNWEGVGVIPHVDVSADQAKQKACELALQVLKSGERVASD